MTQRIAWLKGKDNQGKTRYAPASEFTTQSFATLVLGNIYAAVETVVGYGIQFPAHPDWLGLRHARGCDGRSAAKKRLVTPNPARMRPGGVEALEQFRSNQEMIHENWTYPF